MEGRWRHPTVPLREVDQRDLPKMIFLLLRMESLDVVRNSGDTIGESGGAGGAVIAESLWRFISEARLVVLGKAT